MAELNRISAVTVLSRLLTFILSAFSTVELILIYFSERMAEICQPHGNLSVKLSDPSPAPGRMGK